MTSGATKLTIAVIYGGLSGEHEVSVISAQSIIANLDTEKYDILPLYVDKKRQWWLEDNAGDMLNGISAEQRRLSSDTQDQYLTHTDGSAAKRIDVAFPIMHGTGGEDGSLQGLLQLAGIPFVGCDVLSSSIGMDKVIQKKLLESAGLPIVDWHYFTASEWSQAQDDIVATIEEEFTFPVFVKPANGGSSVGISKAHHHNELLDGIADAFRFDTKVIIEAAVPNARELECAALGNEEFRISVFGEIVSSNEFYDYAAKYVDNASETHIPADLPSDVATHMTSLAESTYKCLGAQGMARIDFLIAKDTGEIFVNEINTLPGFTSISMYPKLWEASGLPYNELLDTLITLAKERFTAKEALQHDFSSHIEKLRGL